MTCTVPALLLASSAVASEIDVYGKLNVTLQNSEEPTKEQVELKSNASRVGVKGEQALEGHLKAVYQLEWGIDFDRPSGDDNLTARNQFIGLEGRFGTVKVGRHDTALKQAQGDFDLFDDLEGDIAKVFNGENRLKDYIGYTTPTFSAPVSVTVNLFPGEDPAAGDDGVADRTSVSLTYETKILYVAIARDGDVDGAGSGRRAWSAAIRWVARTSWCYVSARTSVRRRKRESADRSPGRSATPRRSCNT